ncbi:hypothetical protein JQ608_45010 [Bradyrhizobium liaoningense]|nr:hypothetical protein [Bradyrhizobium liaoningense]MBR0884073.1 hypothetical protein [Bradyrhizobium liaoningense]
MTKRDDRTVLERFREFVMMESSAPHMLVEALERAGPANSDSSLSGFSA